MDVLFNQQIIGVEQIADMPAEQYHALPHVSAGKIEAFRHSRRLYKETYIDGTRERPGPTPAMQLGTLVHLMLLEPHLAESAIADPLPDVAPDGKKWLRRSGSDHERWWNEELAKRDGKITVDNRTRETAMHMVAATMENERAKRLIKGQRGNPEYTIIWEDPESGLRCQCRVDYMAPIAVDLKTSSDVSPREYAKSLVGLGYLRKRAHYMAGLAQAGVEQFVHVAIQSSPPYTVAVYEIDDADKNGYSLGVCQRRTLLHDLAQCLDNGDWREPWEKRVFTLQPPNWAFYEDVYAMGDD